FAHVVYESFVMYVIKGSGHIHEYCIQGLHLAASSATIPPYHTKSGISKENISPDLIFEETEFLKASDFDEPPIDPYGAMHHDEQNPVQVPRQIPEPAI